MPARVRSERTSLSNCANAARTPSISFPVEVSSIDSVAERNEMPSDCRWERSAKWSYLRHHLLAVFSASCASSYRYRSCRGLRVDLN